MNHFCDSINILKPCDASTYLFDKERTTMVFVFVRREEERGIFDQLFMTPIKIITIFRRRLNSFEEILLFVY